MDKDEIVAMSVLVLTGVLIGMGIGFGVGDRDMRQFRNDAVKAGYAQWVGGEDGHPVFTWIPKTEK